MLENTDWKGLLGQQVQVHKDGRVVRTGYVEDVVDSADILWLGADGVKQRALFERALGYRISPISSALVHQS
ncbi:hypothetical protein [Pseudarthrobacter sp. H2]|uniref:hypothetical protein n=1 Tax=Pseudarthrobacter sp. H2 TaxID=3418415 RepID=UPI003CFB20D7